MSKEASTSSETSQIDAELYFLIARFLSAGPCQEAATILRRQIQEHKLLPKRVDWEGVEHLRSFENLIELNRHIPQDHLKRICQRVGPLLDKEVKPSIAGVQSLLGAGSLSLLRTAKDIHSPKWAQTTHVVQRHRRPLLPPHNLVSPSIVGHLLPAREFSGGYSFNHVVPTVLYSKISGLCRRLGHLCAVYCVMFDRTGKYIITGADDHLVKIWSSSDGRLLATLRGHSGEITDIAVNYENTYLAAGSCDKVIRVWCLKTKAPVAVLTGHTGMITSLQFCPLVRGDIRYLLSTGGDGCVCFWSWNITTGIFCDKPIKFIERSRVGAQMLCSSFSPGGIFLATGNSDHVIRVYCFTTAVPEKVCELENHTDQVDSIAYSHCSNRFVSGSQDGMARLWRYERQVWTSIIFNMATKLPNSSKSETEENATSKLKVTMVTWNLDDSFVITAVNDSSIKVWNPDTGKLVRTIRGHDDEVYVLEGSPVDPRLLISAGHDGNIMVWDITTGTKIESYFNMIAGQGHGAVFDAKFSPNGDMCAATDSHGQLIMFGFGSRNKSSKIPEELFFHTDYRPLIRDVNNYVLDEQTQQPPHQMPPPFLVDIDGNPYPPEIQRLVPGRELCKNSQLVPELTVNEDGDHEVIGDSVPFVAPMVHGESNEDGTPANLDTMIVRMQREQDQRLGVVMGPPAPVSGSRNNARAAQGFSPGAQRVGMRRSGESEGVRQSLENVHQRATPGDLASWKHRIFIKELDPAVARQSEKRREAYAEEELRTFLLERKKKPLLPEVGTAYSTNQAKTKRQERRRENRAPLENEEAGRNRLTTRALYDTEEEESSSGTSGPDLWDTDKESENESSEYSDWIEETGASTTLQPPKRSRRNVKRKRFSTTEEETSSEDDTDNNDDSVNDPDHIEPEIVKKVKKPPQKKKVKKKPRLNVEDVTEVPEQYRPTEWITGTIPRKAPYQPQMGDEVMYFRQGHERYAEEVKKKGTYEINLNRNLPWHKLSVLREQELVKIVGIKYEMRPPRLCCLKLAHIDSESGRHTGSSFSIKYHDMPDVIDFLVLKSNYDAAMKRKWKTGAHFRSIVDDQWWTGVIVSQEPYQEHFPDSMFLCLNVHWDNREQEKMSPWDLEPPESGRSEFDDTAFPVSPEELKSLMYSPKRAEWQNRDRSNECDRIVHGIEAIMEHSIAEPFLAPVDLNKFPAYAMVIEYPIDLSTIRTRLENFFYRRVNAVQFDVRYLATNAEQFNEPGSQIVKSARILTEAILKFISDPKSTDPLPLLNELSQGREFNWSNLEENDDDEGDSTPGSATNRKRKRDERNAPNKRLRRGPPDPDAWRSRCKDLLTTIIQCQDSEPFRSPVDVANYLDYYDVIQSPMDLASINNHLLSDEYEDPNMLLVDMRLIFSNSKLYNINKKSRIYTMTLRLSAMFEEQVRDIIDEWKSAVKTKRSIRRPVAKRKSSRPTNKVTYVSSPSKSRSASQALTSQSSCVTFSTQSDSSTSTTFRTSRSSEPSVSRQNGYGPAATSGRVNKGGQRLDAQVQSRRSERSKVKKFMSKTEQQSDNSDDLSASSSETEESDEWQEETTKKKHFPNNRQKKKKLVKKQFSSDTEDISEDEMLSKRPVRKATSLKSKRVSSDTEDLTEEEIAPKRTVRKSASVNSKRLPSESEELSEEEPRAKRPVRKPAVSSCKSGSKSLSNGATKYTTRASTGSIKPRDYANIHNSSDDEDDDKYKKKTKKKKPPPVAHRSSLSKNSSESSSATHLSSSGSSTSSNASHNSETSSGSDTEPVEPRQSSKGRSRKSVRVSTLNQRPRTVDNLEDADNRNVHTRNQGRRTIHYQEESDNGNGNRSEDSNSINTPLTMSSRGRIRRLTPRARASLLGE